MVTPLNWDSVNTKPLTNRLEGVLQQGVHVHARKVGDAVLREELAQVVNLQHHSGDCFLEL